MDIAGEWLPIAKAPTTQAIPAERPSLPQGPPCANRRHSRRLRTSGASGAVDQLPQRAGTTREGASVNYRPSGGTLKEQGSSTTGEANGFSTRAFLARLDRMSPAARLAGYRHDFDARQRTIFVAHFANEVPIVNGEFEHIARILRTSSKDARPKRKARLTAGLSAART